MRRRYSTVFLGLGAAALTLALTARLLPNHEPRRAGPQTLQEALAIVEGRGLHHASDEAGGVPVHHLIVSELPLAPERARLLRLDPTHPCWAGTVSIRDDWRTQMPNYDPACSAVWGELFVFGDPVLVKA